ncbi:MAG: aspartate/glutamate racemase family protein [Caldimonas sp.]
MTGPTGSAAPRSFRARDGLSAAPVLGVLMLDTRFPRVLGDIGNPASFAFPVRYAVVRGASARRVVQGRDRDLLEPFIDAARELVREGASAVSTSCGFLVVFQDALQQALGVPVWTSSLLLVRGLQAQLGAGRRVGVVTVDGDALAPAHLEAAGALPDVPVEGLARGCAFQRCLLDDEPTLDVDAAGRSTVEAAQRLVARCPDVDALVLECTNMPPYAAAVRRATGLPVHDITTLLAERFPPAPHSNPSSP